MNLQQLYPVGSTVLNLSSHLAKVVGYNNDNLVVEGIGEFAGVGKWEANPEKTIRLSNSHFGIANGYEYFTFNKDLYRAILTNPVAPDGYRQGARLQMPLHLVDSDYLRSIGL